MRKIFASFLVFVFGFIAFSLAPISAKVISDEKGTVNVAKTEVVNDDLFIGAQAVEIAGTVNGDLFIGAQAVKITGVINGSVYVGASSIDLSGAVISGSVFAGAGTISIDKASVIGGSVFAGAGTLSLNSQVKRSVYAGTGQLTIGETARIGKDVYYASGKNEEQATISKGAKLAGTVHKSEVNTAQKNTDLETAKAKIPAVLSTLKVTSTFLSFLGALVIGFLYLKLSGKHFGETAGLVTASFWKSLGIGFLVSLAFVPGLIVLLITVIGIPVVGLAVLMFFLYAYLAKIVVGSALGSWLTGKFNWKMSPYAALVLGLAVFYLLKMIPIVGSFTGLVVFWTGLGALTLHLFSKSE